MAIDQESLSKVRAYTESLQGKDRSEFISKFKALKNEESIKTLASRLPDVGGAPSVEPKSAGEVAKNSAVSGPQALGQILPGDVQDAFGGAGAEMVRGFQQQGADTFGNIAMVDPTGIASKIQDASQQSANNIPQTKLGDIPKGIYQTIGRAPGAYAEFLLLNAMTNAARVPMMLRGVFGEIPANAQMSEAVTLGVQSAINEYRNSESFVEASKAFSSGATTSLAVASAADAIPKAVDLGKKLGKNAAKSFLHAITGDEKFAEEFVRDPMKFNLNPFSKVRSYKDVELENAGKIKALDDDFKLKMQEENLHIAEKKKVISQELDHDMFQLKEHNKSIKGNLHLKNAGDVDKVIKDSATAHQGAVDGVHAGLHDDMNNVLNNIEAMKEKAGERVKQAVDNITNKDPFSTISSKPYLIKFSNVLNDNGLRVDGNQVVAKFGEGSADPALIQRANEYMQAIVSINQNFKIPLGFAQGLKTRAQQSGYSATGAVANFEKQLSGALNPVNFTDNIIGRGIKPELLVLKESNSQFSELKPKYDEAIKFFTKPDAQGKPVADFQKVLNAIKQNDRTALSQIAKADSLLPAEQRILPKAYKAASKLNEADTIQRANVRIAKRTAQKKMAELNTKIRETEFRARQANKDKKFGEAQMLSRKLNEMQTVGKAKLESAIKTLEDQTEYFRQLNVARSFMPPSSGRRAIQGAGAVTAVGNIINNPTLALASGAGAVALSPKVGSAVVKQGARMFGGSSEILKTVADLVNNRVGRVIATQAID